MPRYKPAQIEPKWQQYWDEHKTFKTPEMPAGEKLYVLDMFPYPSGDGLHVGHPEGYTATDIVCRFERMRGKSVLHPMGFDAFGLPAEEHAIKTNTPPRESTEKNIDTFRRQLKMLGFSYDWDRELATTDVEYFRWTQWIFLVLFDTWFDHEQQKGRPIAELPIPAEVAMEGSDAVCHYQNEHRLAYQSDALVNWCPELGTVLANEEVIDGKSERGGHPVQRIPLRQWMLRITAYGDRLEMDLETLDWSESIKTMQREWIGRSTGAELDFFIGQDEQRTDGNPATDDFEAWKTSRQGSGYPKKPGEEVLRIYTTRPDTLFGATYMVIAPEHPFVGRLTTAEQQAEVEKYCQAAASKSDLDRTDLSKKKTGVFTGSHAINPVNGELVPVWIADYVLISYGTGAIMAVPAHDERDFEFAKQFQLPIRMVVKPREVDGCTDDFMELYDKHFATGDYINLTHVFQTHPNDSTEKLQERIAEIPGLSECITILPAKKGVFLLFKKLPTSFEIAESLDIGLNIPQTFDGTGYNSGKYNGLATTEFKTAITNDLSEGGIGRQAVNYKLRDWLFSRQRFWGEPFPILHELGEEGKPNGHIRAVEESDLPVDLPHLEDYKPHGRPEPPLAKAPDDWLYVEIGGKKYRRETNTMPQWAGSCWYFLRFIDPKNNECFLANAKEQAWMPVDLYIGGAEHAVLHLLYSRFWHKVLFDRGHVSTIEPFQKLVNQGMILGDIEFAGYQREDGTPVSSADVKQTEEGTVQKSTGEAVTSVKIDPEAVEKQGENFVLVSDPNIRVESRAFKMSKSRGNVVNPDDIVRDYGADSLRLYEMFMGPLEAAKPWSMQGVGGVHKFLDRAWNMIIDMHADAPVLNSAVQDAEPQEEALRTLHKTIKAVTEDLERMSFNTGIARLMEFVNYFNKESVRPKSIMESFVLLLSPYAPHLAEELWQLLGNENSLAYEPWPKYDEALTRDDTVEIAVQLKGKVKTKISVPAGADKSTLEAAARADEKVQQMLADKEIIKVIAVPGRLVNFVTK